MLLLHDIFEHLPSPELLPPELFDTPVRSFTSSRLAKAPRRVSVVGYKI